MPIYEFVCRACHKGFEVTRSISEAPVSAACPHCGSRDVERTWTSIQAITSKKS